MSAPNGELPDAGGPYATMENIVFVPCKVQDGAFPHERVIYVETVDGFISGFIQTKHIKGDAQGGYYIEGVVVESQGGTLLVKVPGSFFTTNGLAHFAREQIRHGTVES